MKINTFKYFFLDTMKSLKRNITLFLIVNAIKMVIFSRKSEISIMKLVGAPIGLFDGHLSLKV